MRGYDAAEDDCARSENSTGKYLVCAGGYPLASLPSFEAAAREAQTRQLIWSGTGDDLSIYEVETGIHFGVPRRSRFHGVPSLGV